MDRAQKAEAVESLHQTLEQNHLVVLAHNMGLTANLFNGLRKKMSAESISVKVTKNRLALRALKGTKYEQLASMFKGPTVVAASKDPVAAARIAYEFAKENEKFVLLGGALGDKLLDKSGIETLAKLPSLNELRAKLLGMLVTPATRLATLAQAPAGQVARVIGAYAKKG